MMPRTCVQRQWVSYHIRKQSSVSDQSTPEDKAGSEKGVFWWGWEEKIEERPYESLRLEYIFQQEMT